MSPQFAAVPRDFVEELTRAVLHAENRLGRRVKRADLARRLNVSPASLYAYLNGTTLPPGSIFDRLLVEYGIVGAEAGRLSSLRDQAELSQRSSRRTDGPSERVLPIPRQLPAAPPHFIGRSTALGALDELVLGRAEPRTAVAVALSGTAGVGKTALALHWCHRATEHFPDGQLYAELRGFDRRPPATAADVLLGFLRALGVAPDAAPDEVEAMAALYRSLLAGRRMLVLLDNARSAAQVRPLLPGTASSLAVVTSRDRLDSLTARDGAQGISLDVPDLDEALAVLAGHAGAGLVDAEPAAARELVTLCGRLPLAISIAGARVRASVARRIAPLAGELRDAHGRLDELGGTEADFDLRTVFSWSYAALPDGSARLLRLLSVHPGTHFDVHACAALLGGTESPQPPLRGLTAANLVTERSPGRFVIHDLLRIYAAELADQDDPAAAVAALERLLDYYIEAARRANARVQPSWTDAEPPRHTGSLPAVPGYEEAMSWFAAEMDTMSRLVDAAAERGLDPAAWQLAWRCTVYLRRTGMRTERARLQRAALDAAQRAGNELATAVSQRLLADALCRLGALGKAAALLRLSLRASEELGAKTEMMQAHLSCVRLHHAEGRHHEALGHAERALQLAAAGGEALSIADGSTAVAKQLALLGHPGRARELAQRALKLYRQTGHAEGEADILLVLGGLELRAGADGQAERHIGRSLEIDRLLGDRYWEAHASNLLAGIEEARGDLTRAREHRRHALALLEALHHPDAEAVRAALGAETRGRRDSG